MTDLTILHEAEEELREAVAYYESRSAGLGSDFLADIESSVQALAQAPGRWPLREDGTRRCLAQRFPFVVVYVHQADHVWIVAFAHCQRRPRYWSGRIGTSGSDGG